MFCKHIPETVTLMEDMKHTENVMLDAEMVVLSTDFQTAGRGQHDHKWESARGENLILGIIIHHPKYEPSQQKRLSDDVAEAVKCTVDHWLKERELSAWVKQPNDIYVGSKKLAGLLIEHDIQGEGILLTRIGIGLNVNQTQFRSDAPNPCSMATLLSHSVDRNQVFNLLLQKLNAFVAH